MRGRNGPGPDSPAPRLGPASSSPTAATAAFPATFHPGRIPVTAEQRRQTSGQHGEDRLQTLWAQYAGPATQFLGGRDVRVSAGPLSGPSPNSGY